MRDGKAGMRVAVLNRDPFTHPGGDLIHIASMTEALKSRGIERAYVSEEDREGDAWTRHGYDLAHLYHCNFGWCQRDAEAARRAGIPLAVTPIFYPREFGVAMKAIGEMLSGSMLLPYCEAEFLQISQLTAIKRAGLECVPPGIDPRLFFNSGGLDRGHSVLAVEPRPGSKNAHLVQAACRRIGNVDFLCARSVPLADMPIVYNSFKVMVHASDFETFCLSAAEALACGCRVIVQRGALRAIEHFPGLAEVDCANADELDAAIRNALDSENWDWMPNDHVRKNLTWEKSAEKLAAAYRRVLG